MVKVVKKEVRRMDKLEPQPIKDSGFDVWHPVTSNVKARFIKNRPWLVPTDSANTVADCIEAKYLRGETSRDSFGNQIDILCILKNGRKLVERTWLIFPTGLWKAWYEDNGKTFFALMTAIIALLTSAVILLGKIVFFGEDI
jgi:hypothetical protein